MQKALRSLFGPGERKGAPEGPPEADASFKRIDLERVDLNIYRAPKELLWRPVFARGVFGGQVLGQALSAVARTVTRKKRLHSMHSYFLRKGDDSKDIIYLVTRLRDGRAFSSRTVLAQQDGKAIFILMASFHIEEEGKQIERNAPMPTVPMPEDLLDEDAHTRSKLQALLEKKLIPSGVARRIINAPLAPIEQRYVFPAGGTTARRVLTYFGIKDRGGGSDSNVVDAKVAAAASPSSTNPDARQGSSDGVSERIVWMRCRRRLPDNPAVHTSVLAYASDMTLLGTARGTSNLTSTMVLASLDHSMHFHVPFPRWRADEWFLYVQKSERCGGGRGHATGKIYTSDGTLAVTVMQEGLMRLPPVEDEGEGGGGGGGGGGGAGEKRAKL